jgi:hypothetical protein
LITAITFIVIIIVGNIASVRRRVANGGTPFTQTVHRVGCRGSLLPENIDRLERWLFTRCGKGTKIIIFVSAAVGINRHGCRSFEKDFVATGHVTYDMAKTRFL